MWPWLIVLLTGLTLLLISRKILTRDGKNLPPLRDGWLPWLGAAFQMRKEPLMFLNLTRKELGDIFTIHFAGKHITYMFGQINLEHFFTCPYLNIKDGIQPYVVKAAGVTKESFYANHTSNHAIIKEGLRPEKLITVCEELSLKFHQEMTNVVTGEMDLMELARMIMFPAVVKQMFGDNLLPDDREAVLEFQNILFKYDDGFEYGTELPDILVKEWSNNKQWLRNKLDQYISKLSDHSTPFQKVVARVHRDSAPGDALLLLWGVQVNVLPVVFWSFCHILSNRDIHEEVIQEAKTVLPLANQLGDTPVTYHMIQQLSTIKRCVLEALRLCAPGIATRKVIKNHTFKGYTIPKGHYLAISPYWEHRNPEKFPDPDRFNPDRWKSCDLNKFQFLDGFIGFSGGNHQCPARYFALTEMFMIVAMVINKFDLKLTTEVPQMSYSRFVGTQQPSQPCRVMISERK